MLGAAKKTPAHLAALDRVLDWTRQRFELTQAEAVLVTELACALPDCPPLETVVAFWTMDTTRHHFKIFKPVEEVSEEDLPYRWQKKSLAEPEGYGCDCC